MPNDLELERNKLEDVLNKVTKTFEIEKKELYNLEHSKPEDEDLWLREISRKKIHISNLEYAKDKPYFARIDFEFDNHDNITVYIGKNGLIYDDEVVITDWRAPISSLYYNASKGPASYSSPSGKITGTVLLKRQFEIEHGILEDFIDVDIASSDLLLQKYLSSNNNDARLKNIVATIQKEQNEVIRKDLYDSIIVQGVAGSGKTTVALHRIAYLVYNYKMHHIMQNQYLVIGPNPVFLKYIKQVLPELDVDSVQQFTFETFAEKYIGEKLKIKSSDDKVNNSINGKLITDIDKIKCSIKYKEMLDKFYNKYILSLTKNDLMLGEFRILSSKEITDIFNKTKADYKGSSLNTFIEQSMIRMSKCVKDNYYDIMDRFLDYEYEIFSNTKDVDKDSTKLILLSYRKEIGKYCKSIINKYFDKQSVTKIYKLFINGIEDYNIYNYNNINILKENTLNNLKKNIYEFEDLSPLIYLKSKICPNLLFSSNVGENEIKHVVIDEAQDLGEFNFIALKEVLPKATFSIFGDLAQSIYDYRGVDNWNSVNDVMFNGRANIVNFNKSYRTTFEIMNVADVIAEHIGLNKSDLVIRHGSPVEFNKLCNNDVPKYILNRIKEFKDLGYKSIAVISKTDNLSNSINKELNKISGYKIPNVEKEDDISDESFNICTISNQLAKGLEFDCVIINNVSEDIYSSNNSLDMKLLYVATTRALHRLDIIYNNNLTKPLYNYIQ